MQATTYTADYFLKKFRHKPARLWCTGKYRRGNRHCAYGHCGRVNIHTEESRGLYFLFAGLNISVLSVNDKQRLAIHMGVARKTAARGARARIMAVLRIIKAKGG